MTQKRQGKKALIRQIISHICNIWTWADHEFDVYNEVFHSFIVETVSLLSESIKCKQNCCMMKYSSTSLEKTLTLPVFNKNKQKQTVKATLSP